MRLKTGINLGKMKYAETDSLTYKKNKIKVCLYGYRSHCWHTSVEDRVHGEAWSTPAPLLRPAGLEQLVHVAVDIVFPGIAVIRGRGDHDF